MFWIALIIFLGSIGWAYSEPGWEPFLFAISSMGVLLSHESHVKKFLLNLLPNNKKRTICIAEHGDVEYNNYSGLDIIKSLILNEDIELLITSKEAEHLRKHAHKEEKNTDTGFHLKERAKRLDDKLILVKEGLYRIAALHKKGLIQCQLRELPTIFEQLTRMIFPASISTPVNNSAFDIYVKTNDGNEISFIADFTQEETSELLEKLEVDSTQKLAIPYNFMVSDIPVHTINHRIISKQIFASLTRHKEFADDDSYWFIQNWYFGPH